MQRLLQDTGIMKKIVSMMLMLGFVAVATAGVNAWKMQGIGTRYAEMVDNQLPAITQMVRSNRMMAEMLKDSYRATLFGVGSPQARAAVDDLEQRYKDAGAGMDEAVRLDPELSLPVSDLRGKAAEIHRLSRDGVARSQAGDGAGALRILGEADRLMTAFGASLKKGNDARIAAAYEEAEALGESTSSNLFWTLLITLLATGGGVLVAHRVVKGGIVAPLLDLAGQMKVLADGNHAISLPHSDRKDELGTMSRSVGVFRDQAEQRARMEAEKKTADAEQEHVVKTLGGHLDRLAAGDMTAEISEHFPYSYRQLRMAYNSALRSLNELIRAVTDSAAQIRTGSSEIAQASEDLARRTESNAASLEQTSAAIQQMDGRLKAGAGAATATVGRADQAISTVSGGRELADEAVSAMGRVSDSAKGIDSVIEGLDKIAFQTRVLAMNAAVEAGRAGEAGRGFAVVADLVSALAMRAEEEAKRARDQLTVTQTDIVAAVGAVEKVDGALQNISADVGEVHQLLGSIARDNQAQALAISEVNAAIASMDQSTQQNAAMVEQTSAAARNLLTEVNTLAEQSGRFRCGPQPAGAPAVPVTRAPVSVAVPVKAAVPPAAAKAPTAPARPAPAPAPRAAKPSAGAVTAAKSASPKLPKRGKEGSYQSPVKALPAAAIASLNLPSDEDWNDF